MNKEFILNALYKKDPNAKIFDDQLVKHSELFSEKINEIFTNEDINIDDIYVCYHCPHNMIRFFARKCEENKDCKFFIFSVAIEINKPSKNDPNKFIKCLIRTDFNFCFKTTLFFHYIDSNEIIYDVEKNIISLTTNHKKENESTVIIDNIMVDSIYDFEDVATYIYENNIFV